MPFNDFFNDDDGGDETDRRDDDAHDAALAVSTRTLLASTPTSLSALRRTGKASFVLPAEDLKSLINKSSLKHVAGHSIATATMTVEIGKGRVRFSTVSTDTATRATSETETFIADERLAVVSFGIPLIAMAKISSAFGDDILSIVYAEDKSGDYVEIRNVDRRGRYGFTKLKLSVGAAHVSRLLEGERRFCTEIASTTKIAKAIRLCRAAIPSTKHQSGHLDVRKGIAIGQSHSIIIRVRDPDLPDLLAAVPIRDAKKIALAFHHMRNAQLFETDDVAIVDDGIVEIAMRKTRQAGEPAGDPTDVLTAEEPVEGKVQDLLYSAFVAEIAKGLAQGHARRGRSKFSSQLLADVTVEDGAVKCGMMIPNFMTHNWTAMPSPDPVATGSSDWGTIDLLAVERLWAELEPGDADKPMTLATCKKGAMKLSSPRDFLDAYFLYHDRVDHRFRTR